MSEFDSVIQSARAGFEPSAADRERVWSRLSVRAGLAGAAVALVAKTSAGSSLLAGQSVGALAKLFFTSLGVTLVAGSAVVGVTRFRPWAGERATVSSPLASTGTTRSVAPASSIATRPAPVPSEVVPLSTVDSARPSERSHANALPSSEPAPGRPEIARELALLQAVRQAGAAGQHARAERLLDDLDREIPQGALLEERAALRAIAACEGGRANRSERAAAFLRRYPASVYAAKVQHVCRIESSSSQASDGATRSFTDVVGPGH
jgi:hypothetical protein